MEKVKILTGIIIILTFGPGFMNQEGSFLLESNGFKMEFPKKPDYETQMLNSAAGELKMNIYTYDASKSGNDDNLLYGFIFTDYPDSLISSDKKEILSDFFRNSIAGSVNNVKGKLLSEKNIEINGFPGREIKVDYREGMAIIKTRIYLVKNRLYIIQTITETRNGSNKSIDKFMDSFRLTI
jgi:hypothetical protein